MTDFDKIPMLEPYKVDVAVSALSETVDYNHRMMNVEEMWRETRGKGVKIVILDTGCPNHVDIRTCGHANFAGGRDAFDRSGHGTHVAGLIGASVNGIGVRGIAPDADMYFGKVLGDDGSGSIDAISRGIRWAVDEVGADVINMSLGCPASMGVPDTLRAACEYAYRHDVTICAAAGNDAGAVNAPACLPTTLAVAAVDKNERSADFSCRGPEIDFATGGVDVFSTWLNNTYARLSGTSMACPALSAVVSLLISAEKARSGRRLTPSEVYSRLVAISKDIGRVGKDDFTGNGIPIFASTAAKMTDKSGGMTVMSRILTFILGIFGIRR